MNKYVVLLRLRVAHNAPPVEGLHVAQRRILLDAHTATHDACQTMQAECAHELHLVDGERVVLDQSVTTNDCQFGQHLAEALNLVGAEKQKVVGDFHQVGKREVEVLLRLRGQFIISNSILFQL